MEEIISPISILPVLGLVKRTNLSKITDIDETTLKSELKMIQAKSEKQENISFKKTEIKQEESKIKEEDPTRKTEEFVISAILANQQLVHLLKDVIFHPVFLLYSDTKHSLLFHQCSIGHSLLHQKMHLSGKNPSLFQ